MDTHIFALLSINRGSTGSSVFGFFNFAASSVTLSYLLTMSSMASSSGFALNFDDPFFSKAKLC
jgi:hypothetical protein